MIRRATGEDTRSIIGIWLDASRTAHHFVPYAYWLARVPEMKDVYLPASETYVAVVRGEVAAFVSLVADNLAALFVSPGCQSRGLGSELLIFAQSLRDRLSLSVYTRNAKAMEFYGRHGFRVVEERLDPATGQREAVMVWSRNDPLK